MHRVVKLSLTLFDEEDNKQTLAVFFEAQVSDTNRLKELAIFHRGSKESLDEIPFLSHNAAAAPFLRRLRIEGSPALCISLVATRTRLTSLTLERDAAEEWEP